MRSCLEESFALIPFSFQNSKTHQLVEKSYKLLQPFSTKMLTWRFLDSYQLRQLALDSCDCGLCSPYVLSQCTATRSKKFSLGWSIHGLGFIHERLIKIKQEQTQGFYTRTIPNLGCSWMLRARVEQCCDSLVLTHLLLSSQECYCLPWPDTRLLYKQSWLLNFRK